MPFGKSSSEVFSLLSPLYPEKNPDMVRGKETANQTPGGHREHTHRQK